METKFHLCLLMIILGTIIVQGAVVENQQKNPMHVYAKRGEFFFYGDLSLLKCYFFFTASMKIKAKIMFNRFGQDSFMTYKRKISSHLQRVVNRFMDIVCIRSSSAPVLGALVLPVQGFSNAVVLGMNLES